MSSYIIRGGRPLAGETVCQGSKNSSLPILAACILSDREIVLENVPQITDVEATLKILEHLGCAARREGHVLTVDAGGMSAGGCDFYIAWPLPR